MKKITLFLLTLITSVVVWAQDPYFEVTDGSFASGDVTLKATFPGYSSVVMNPDEEWSSATLRYGSKSVQYVYSRNGNITSGGVIPSASTSTTT